MSELIPDRLAEWRSKAQDAEREVDRLRRERETLAEAVRGWQRYLEKDLGKGRVHALTISAHEEAFSLLNSETPHTTIYRQLDECSDGWECTAPDCDTAWTLPNGGPSHHRMLYCPGCGRRIVGEEPWRDGDGT